MNDDKFVFLGVHNKIVKIFGLLIELKDKISLIVSPYGLNVTPRYPDNLDLGIG